MVYVGIRIELGYVEMFCKVKYGVVIVFCMGLSGNYFIEGFCVVGRKGKRKGFGIGCRR